jgi:hypothetical protein
MHQLISKGFSPLGILVIFFTFSSPLFSQQNSVASVSSAEVRLRLGVPPKAAPLDAAESTRILAGFVAAETRVREALNQHTFKRDVTLQTIGPNGEVTGEYIRNSQFIFDDRGRRIERVLFHPASTIHEMRITKEDIQDLEGSQLLGIDIAEASKYQLTYAGMETVDTRQLFAVDVNPLIQPDPSRMKERFFVGRVWVDPNTFQIVKIKGVVEPQGKQRFPMFVTWREPINNALAFPTRTEADEVLHFQDRDVHYRIKVRYHDYKMFASKVSVKEVDDDPQPQLDESTPATKKSPAKTPPSSKISAAHSEAPLPIIRPLTKAEVCTTNRNAPPVGEYHWPADAEVKVYFVRGMFTPEQSSALLEAMKTWKAADQEIGSGVRFVYAGETDSRVTCRSCLTVTRREVFKSDKHHYAFFNPMKMDEGRLLVTAWIDLDVGITDPKALQGFVAHELGHGLGLWDCPSCKKKQSLMNGFPGLNQNNGRVGPSSCDVATTKAVYAEERQITAFNSSDLRGSEPVRSGSNLALPAIGLEKANFSVLDGQRRLLVPPASKPSGDTRSASPGNESSVTPTPQGIGKENSSRSVTIRPSGESRLVRTNSILGLPPVATDKSKFSMFNLQGPVVRRFLLLGSGAF